MKYIIIILILFIFSSNFALAQDADPVDPVIKWLNKIQQQTEQKVIKPVQQLINSMKQKDADKKGQELLQEAQNLVEQKQEELTNKAQERIKQEIKTGAKNWFKNRVKWIEEKFAPLKIKVQEGSALIREWANKIKNYLFE